MHLQYIYGAATIFLCMHCLQLHLELVSIISTNSYNSTQLIFKDDERFESEGNIYKRRVRRGLYVIIAILVILIYAQFIYFVSGPCIDPIKYPLFLNIKSVTVMVSLYYSTFFFMMLNNWFLWRHIRKHNLTVSA